MRAATYPERQPHDRADPHSKLAVHSGNPPGTLCEGFPSRRRVAILDLEDAVAPGDKERARTTALDYLTGNPANGALHPCESTGSTRLRAFLTWTHYSDPRLLRTFWCCPRRRRPAILKYSIAS